MNTPETHTSINRFLHAQRKRDTWQYALLGFFSLMFIGSLAVAFMAWQKNTAGQLSIAAPLALTLLSALLIIRQWRMMLATAGHYRAMSLPTRTAIETLADAVRQRISEYRLLMASVVFVLLPVFGVAAFQLMMNGKMSGSDVASFMVLVVVAAISLLAVLRHRIRNQLEPELQQLDELQQHL